MKQEMYNVTVLFSKSGILACECGCKAGSKGMDKVVCVHVLPVLMQLVVLLVEDLGESILIELCNRWDSSLDEASTSMTTVRASILQIMSSIGCSEHEIDHAKLAPSIKHMFDTFCVGTEKKKKLLCHQKMTYFVHSLNTSLFQQVQQ